MNIPLRRCALAVLAASSTCALAPAVGTPHAAAATGTVAMWASPTTSGHAKFTLDSPVVQSGDVGRTVVLSVTGHTGLDTPDASTLHLQWSDGSTWHAPTGVSAPIVTGATTGLKVPVTSAMVGHRVQLYGQVQVSGTGTLGLSGAVVLGSGHWDGSTSFTVPVASINASSLGVAVAFVHGTSQANQDRIFSDIAASGARRVRIGIGMDKVAHRNADGSWGYDFTEDDRTVDTALAHGLRPLVILQSLPVDFAAQSSGHPVHDVAVGPTTEAERTAFAAFAKATVAHFSSRVSDWELWNEENLSGFWGGAGSPNPDQPAPSAAAYAQLLKAVYPAVHAAQPTATLMVGGMGDAGDASSIPSEDFLRQLYADGAQGSFDAVAAHVYGDAIHNTTEFIDQLPDYRATMDAHGDAHKQLWVTESGDIVGPGLATEAQQADMMRTTWNTLNALHDHGPMFQYTMDNTSTGSSEVGFGMLDSAGNRRPVFTAMQQLAASASTAP